MDGVAGVVMGGGAASLTSLGVVGTKAKAGGGLLEGDGEMLIFFFFFLANDIDN